MSWALTACILIRAHARPRQWLTVDELAEHLLVAPGTLRAQANAMHEAGQVELRHAEDGTLSHLRAVLPQQRPEGACA